MSTVKSPFAVTGTRTALALTLSLFVIWGMGQHYYYTMMPQLVGHVHLQGLALYASQYIPTLASLVAAVPGAIYARRLGYKAAVLLGLGCISMGCFTLYPAVAMNAYGYYFAAAATLAIGWVVLEVAANPMAASLGPEEGFVWRLNLAQAMYPIGSMLAIFVGYWLLGTYLFQAGTHFVFSLVNPYIVLGAGVFIIAYWLEDTPFPGSATARNSGGELAALRVLITDRFVLCAMVAQGLGITILIVDGLRAVGGKYLMAAFHLHLPGPLSEVYFWAAVAFAVGRFAGCALMRRIKPERLLAVFALAGVGTSLLALAGWPLVSGFAVLANQFFASILWPTILGLAIRGRGPQMPLATALVCIGSAVGGGLAQVLFANWNAAAVSAGMLIPAVCFLGIFGFARVFGGRMATAAAGQKPVHI